MKALALLVALLLAPAAAAHVSVNEETQSATLGDRFLFFSPSPSVVYAGEDYLAALTVNGFDFRPARGLNVTLEKDGTTHAAREVGAGTYVVSLNDTVPGKKDLAYEVPTASGNGTVRWNVTVNVYPDLGVVAVPADEGLDAYVGRPLDFGVRLLDRASGETDPRVQDVRFRFERWSDDHKTKLGEEVVEASPRDGAWWSTVTFDEPGMVHARVASESVGMGFEDAPYVHLYVVPPPATSPPGTNDASAVGALAALVALALVARRVR